MCNGAPGVTGGFAAYIGAILLVWVPFAISVCLLSDCFLSMVHHTGTIIRCSPLYCACCNQANCFLMPEHAIAIGYTTLVSVAAAARTFVCPYPSQLPLLHVLKCLAMDAFTFQRCMLRGMKTQATFAVVLAYLLLLRGSLCQDRVC